MRVLNRAIEVGVTERHRGISPGDRLVDRDAVLAEIADDALSAPDMMLLDERERMLHTCLEALEERQRSSIRTAFFDGLTYADLAERAAVPLGTMKSWVRRGLLRLRECLDGSLA